LGQKTAEGLGNLAPITFAKGSMGNSRALQVSTQHRMLFNNHRAGLLFGHHEIIKSAGAWSKAINPVTTA